MEYMAFFNAYTKGRLMSKICARCNTEKEISFFNKNCHSKDGLSPWCRDCEHVYAQAWREKNREKHNARGRKYYQMHKEEYKAYRQASRDKRISYSQSYREIHREYLNASRRLKRQRAKIKAAWDAAKIEPQQLKPKADVTNNAQMRLIDA